MITASIAGSVVDRRRWLGRADGVRRVTRNLAWRRFRAGFEPLEERRVLTTFTVTSLADNGAGSGNSGDLRYVIERADALATGTAGAPDLIEFSGVTLTPADHTIRVGGGAAGAVPLPALTDVATIDGETAGGFDNLTGLLLTLDGSALHGQGDGLVVLGGRSVVEGLQIVNFPGNGILVRSSGNTIGGNTVGYNAQNQRNNPAGRITSPLPPSHTTPVFVRPPDGNVISGNGGDGILIADGADNNFLEGNFVGTDVTGTKAMGNRGDGVAIINSSGNQMLGTVAPDGDNPFVFYNVISGNRGNGLVVRNSNDTTIYANFFGLGADNQTPVGNGGDGVLIAGTSDGTKFGANIPLGNVTAANGKNGVEVAGSASRTILGNSFDGVAAFNPLVQVGNRRDGILVKSAGGGQFFGASRYSTLILTCQASGNGRDGIEIARRSAHVQVSQSVVGMATNGNTPEPNGRDGIEIHGGTRAVAIGGFEPSVAGVPESGIGKPTPGAFFEAANLISGNRLDGVAIEGCARGIVVVNSLIGTNIAGTGPAGNGRDGIRIDWSTHDQVGSPLAASNSRDRVVVAFNHADGVQVIKGTGNSILGSPIYGNGRLGIALQHGGNRGQSAPHLAAATIAASGATQVTGTLSGRPDTTYQVEVFAGASGLRGDGQFFLGSAMETTNARGFARFVIGGLTNPDPTGAGSLSATATGPAGDTSMFSRAVRAKSGI